MDFVFSFQVVIGHAGFWRNQQFSGYMRRVLRWTQMRKTEKRPEKKETSEDKIDHLRVLLSCTQQLGPKQNGSATSVMNAGSVRPSFGNPAISFELTRGFASQPHDWFAFVEKEAC